MRLSATGIDQSLFRQAYEDALKTLDAIKTGALEPIGWPVAILNNDDLTDGTDIQWSSNPKRNNYY